jgi:transcription antitermination factor NusG
MSWYALQVFNNKEYDLKREIVSNNILKEEEVFIPRRMVYNLVEDDLIKKTEKLLPGYALVSVERPEQLFKIREIHGCIDVLGLVSDEEMETILSHENIPEEVGVSVGDKIIIVRGPFAGVRGNILSEENDHLRCRLVFHGNEIFVNMNPNLVEKLI